MEDQRTFCCLACRLLQAPAIECVECGRHAGEIDASRDLLRYRVPSDAKRVGHEVRLATPVVTQQRRGSDPLFAQIGIPLDLLPKTVTVDIRTIKPGTIVAVRGVIEDATLAELAYHRDGGQALAMQGRRGSMVVVRVP